MAAVKKLNPKAEVARAAQALDLNISAAMGLQDVLRTNLGPKGTMKMLVGGAGDIKITKDGNVLLHEMQIQHPTASLIARVATAQDDITGDGTTSNVLIIGELLKQAKVYIGDGLHPRIAAEGFDLAKKKAIQVLDSMAQKKCSRDDLINVARTSLRTKVKSSLADHLTECIVDAVLAIQKEGEAIDLHMVEIMTMEHKTDMDTQLIKGIVMDHGARHPDMKKKVTDAFILTCNVSLEYEKSEVNSGFFYKSADQREKLVKAERAFCDDKVQQRCADKPTKVLLLSTRKELTPTLLTHLPERESLLSDVPNDETWSELCLACGGTAVNSLDDISPKHLGHAGLFYEHVLGDDKYSFIEECDNPQSVTILIKGPNKHTITQIKDAVRDGLRAVKNAVEDQQVVPGAGSMEIAIYQALNEYKNEVRGKARLGVEAFATAMLIIPKCLAQNAGHDAQDCLVKMLQEYKGVDRPVGLDLTTGEAFYPAEAGIWDNYCVKKQLLNSCTVISSNLLIVDEVMRAGMSSLKG
eukprot:sb/3463825/